MEFPGGIRVIYGTNLKGFVSIGIDGALEAVPRQEGIHFINDNPTYGEEMPASVREYITEALNGRYAPVGRAALMAKAAGDTIAWQKLRQESRDLMQIIGKEAKEMWRDIKAA